MHLHLLHGTVRTEDIPECLPIIHLAQRIYMTGEGEGIDLIVYVSIVSTWAGWRQRDLPRRPAPPQSRGEAFQSLDSLPWRSLCGLVLG